MCRRHVIDAMKGVYSSGGSDSETIDSYVCLFYLANLRLLRTQIWWEIDQRIVFGGM